MCFGSIAEALRLSIANKPALKMSDVPRSHRDGHRHRNHASYFADRQAIEVVATEHVEDYRAAADALLRSNDVAIEVGCAGGKTTAVLGCRCAVAYGVDKSFSPNMLLEQQHHAREVGVHFEQLDATDFRALMHLSKRAAQKARERQPDVTGLPTGFSVILVDVSGSAKLSAVLDLVDRYESIFKESLRLIIVKSFRLTCLLDRARPYETSPYGGPSPDSAV